jgi:hypothetical protein
MSEEIIFIPENKPSHLLQNYPRPAVSSLPAWYKKIPPFTNGDKKLRFPIDYGMPNSSIKKCVPFLDAMTSGYMVILEEDIHVEITDEGTPVIRWRSSDELMTFHSPDQYEGMTIPNEYHQMVAKWKNNWSMRTPKGYSLLYTHPFNRLDLPFSTFTGLVDTDSYHNPVQFPFILKKEFEGIITAGTPLCQIIPVKISHWKSKATEYDADQNYLKSKKFHQTFVRSYKKNYWKRKLYE